jgi:hypothetical protein
VAAPPEPCHHLLTPELVAFVHGRVVAMVGSAGADLTPALTRGFAPRIAPDRRAIDVFVGRAQSTACLANLVPGATMSLIVGNPVDYRGIQIKGTVIGRRPVAADQGGAPDQADDAAWLHRGRALHIEALERVGIGRIQSDRLWCRDMVCVTLVPAALFRQTPGPGAGGPLAAGSPWT